MSTLSSIIIFGKDENLLLLLKGYCFSKRVMVTALDFTMSGIREVGKIKPDLILIPINLYRSSKRIFEVSALRREINKHHHIKISALIDSNTTLPLETSISFDFLIPLPIDLKELDDNIEKAFPGHKISDERRYGERRSCAERRNVCTGYNAGYPGVNSNFNLAESKQVIDFKLDPRNRCLLLNTTKVELTPKEYGLIELLMSDVDRIFLTEEIIKHLWPDSSRATKSDLYQYMHMLRKKIENDPNNPKWLTNVKGYGYKLNLN